MLRHLGQSRRPGARPEAQDGARDLARHGVRHAHDRHLDDGRVRREQVLQLAGADVLALADDDVLPPPGDAEVALGVERAEVSGAEAAVGREGVGVQGRVAVAEEALGAARQYLALAPGPDRRAVLVDQADLVRADGAPLAVNAALGRVVGPGRGHGRELGRAVVALGDAAEARRRLAYERRIDVGAAAGEEAEARGLARR